jgi:hypothetical protein
MKSIARILLVGAIAVMAIAISAAPSEAAKKKRHAKMVCSAAGTLCSAKCAEGTCAMKVCGSDGKWYDAVLTPVCIGASCPKGC